MIEKTKLEKRRLKSSNKTDSWVKECCYRMEVDDTDTAFDYLCATLKILRDRLTVNEAAQLGAQLPTHIRGYYYEGFSPKKNPKKIRSESLFLESIKNELGSHHEKVSTKRAVQACLDTIFSRISEGEMEDVIQGLHHNIRKIYEDIPSKH